MRPLTLLLFLLATVHAIAQTDTSYHLLWYKGKKIKPNVLLTTKGDTIRFNPVSGELKVISKSGDGKRFDNMMLELNKTNQRIQQQVTRFAKFPKPVISYYAGAVQQSFTAVQEQYSRILSNVVLLPNLPTGSVITKPGVGGAAVEINIEEDFEETIRLFRQYYKDHANDNLKIVPVPPDYDYSYCFTCDEEGNNAFQHALETFREELTKGDKEMLEKAFLMARKAFYAYGEGKNLRRILREVEMMKNYVLDRVAFRVNTLLEKYIEDPSKTYAVLQVTLETDRIRQLLGREAEDDLIPDDYFDRAFLTVKNKMLRAAEERDYAIALNLQAILSLARTMQLRGIDTDDFLDKMIGFNQFKLNSNITGKIGDDRGYIAGHIRGDNWFAAIPDSSCKLRWVQTGPQIHQSTFNLLSAEFRGQAIDIPYVGTKNWISDIPLLRIDFCSTEQDSIIAYPFYPEGHKELWQFPPPMGVTNAAELRAVLLGCFMDIKQIKRDAQTMQNPQQVEKIKKEMMAQYEMMMKQTKDGKMPASGDMSLQTLSQYSNIQEITRKVTDMIHQKDPGRYVFQPTVHNKDKVIVKDKINGKELFPQNAATQYAWFHITLEHDPYGPYKLRL